VLSYSITQDFESLHTIVYMRCW